MSPPLDSSFAGRSYPPTRPYEVGREKIREFADAIGDPHPAYREPEAARALGYPDVIAPPTFPIIMSMAADAQVVLDPELGIDYARVVHGEQRFAYRRPVLAGDRLTVTLHVDAVRSAGGHSMITTRGEINTVDGEAVCTATSTLVVRSAQS
jgi:acyl dehydratase